LLNRIKYFISDYTNLIIALLLITTFSGALRKWAGLPSLANNLLLLILMLIPTYLVFIFKSKDTKTLNKTITPIFNVFCFTLVAFALHPLNFTYFHGILGILIHLIFIATILSYLKNKSSFNEQKIIKIFFVILTIQLIVGSIQYSSSSDSVINRYADNRQDDTEIDGEEFVEASAFVGEAVRVSGTFSYLGGYTAFVFFLLFFNFYLAKVRGSAYFLFFSPIIIYLSLISGSRSTVGFALILLMVFIITERNLFFKNPRSILTGLTIIVLLNLFNFLLDDKLGIIEKVNTAYDNFMERVETNEEEGKGRLTGDLIEVFYRDFDYRYSGVGLGATYQGANTLFGTSDIVKNTPIEGELFRLLVEGGLFLVFFRWIFVIIIFSFLDIPILMKICLFLFFCVFSQNVFHIYNAIYFALGLIILNQAYISRDRRLV